MLRAIEAEPWSPAMPRALWIVVLCAGTVMGISVGLRQTLGLFLAPVSLDLGIGRETFALGMGLMNLVWGLAAPFAGAVADRWGSGRVAVLGGLAYAGGLAVMTMDGGGGQLLAGGVLIGVGLSGAGFTVILGTVGRAAPEAVRSRALGLTAMAGSLGQFLALPYAQALISGLGWSFALLVLAATALAIVPLARGFAGAPPASPDAGRQSLREALAGAGASRDFWLLNAGFFVCGFHLAFIGIHLPAYLADLGFAPWLAAATLTVVGFSNILGSYVCGVLGGRFPKKSVLSTIYVARSAIFLVFIATPVSEASVLAFGAAMGLLWLGTVPLTSGLVAHIWGTRHMSMLFGIVFLGHQLGGFLGAWVAGRVYDAVGSYTAMWWLCVALGLASAALHWPIAERRAAVPAAA